MFHRKLRSASLFVIQKRLFTASLAELMRLHQMRIISYFKSASNNHFMTHTNSHDITPSYTRKWKPTSRLIAEPRSPSISTNKKPDRFFNTNSATSGFTHQSFTTASHMKNTLIFNRKSANSEIMCQSLEIEVNSFKNMSVASNSFSRKCRHCKQFFTSGNLLHRHISRCNESIKGFKHARIAKKLNGPWRKLSN